MPAFGITFHHFHDGKHPRGQGSISAKHFAQLLNQVGCQRILSADEWMHRALEGTLGEDDICLTFDDALRCQIDVALPVMRDCGMTAFWFVYSSVFEGNIENLEIYRNFRTTAFKNIDEFYDQFSVFVKELYPDEHNRVESGFNSADYLTAFPFYTTNDRVYRYLRDEILGPTRYALVMQAMLEEKNFDIRKAAETLWMNDADLRMLRDEGHVVGLHSYSHPTRLNELSPEKQLEEYRRNFEHLYRILGEPAVSVSHPCNSYTGETLNILRTLGIRLGFSATMEDIPGRSCLEFPRQDHVNL